jgi:hypothetical protein
VESPNFSISSRVMTILLAVEARRMDSSLALPLISTRRSCSVDLASAAGLTGARAAGAEAAAAGAAGGVWANAAGGLPQGYGGIAWPPPCHAVDAGL